MTVSPAPAPAAVPSSAPDTSAQHRRGVLLVAAAAVCWSSGGAIVRLLETDTWTTVLWRSAFGALFLLLFILLRDRGQSLTLFRRMGWPGLGVALCFATASTSFVYALHLTTVANILIIQSTAPFIAGLLGLVLLGERVTPRAWAAMGAALVGVVIMVSGGMAGGGSLLGNLLAFVIAFAFSGVIVIARRHAEVRMTPASCLAAVFAGLFALPFATPLSPSPQDFGLLLLFGAGQLGIGMALFTFGVRLIPAAEAALLSVLENILGPLWVWIFFAEDPGTAALVGGAIVLGALVVHTAFDLAPVKRAVPPPA